MIEQRIKALIDKRTIEATRKDLSNKLQTIVRAFGKPIIEQTVSYTMLPDFWELDAPEIPEISDDSVFLRGYYFDGLNQGINLCIKLIVYESHMSELRVTYNGYQVFLENEGELKSYVPFQSWEEAVDKLYFQAKPAVEEKTKNEKLEQKEVDKKRAKSIMGRLRELWGI